MDNEKTSRETDVVTVAYADDHTAVRKGIISYLHELGGIEVIIEAKNGKELIERLEKSKRLPDVTMVDINMPEMNGFTAIGLIKQKWKDMKTLVLSTYVEDLYVVRMIRSGVNGYLSKACDPEEIKEALITIHKKGTYYSDLFVQKLTVAAQEHRLKIPNITEKELLFLKYCCSDLTYVNIAQLMKTTLKSVEGYRDSLFKKIQVNSRVSLALFAVQSGIVLIDSGPIK